MTPVLDDTILISFSGLDCSGKTTQIEHLCVVLAQMGLRTRVLTLWDDVVVGARWREGFVHRVFRSEKGIGAPEKPVERRDKNIGGWPVSLARHLMYLADVLRLRLVLWRARRSAPAVIMDRYIYDELANLPLTNAFSRAFVRFVLAVAPRPDVAYLLDADPEAARARKPEYPVEFLRRCRRAYLDLAAIAGLTVIPPLALDSVRQEVEAVLRRVLKAPADTVRAA